MKSDGQQITVPGIAVHSMNRRGFLAMALTLTGAGVLAGCGGGGNSTISPTRQVHGTVTLPAGYALTPASLRVDTGAGGEAVDSGGHFSATINGDSPTLAWARTADKGVLLGFLDPGDSDPAISARTTAIALLYFGLGGFTLPSTNTKTLLGLIGAHATIGPLIDTLTRRLIANPTALTDGDSELGNALKSAIDTILAERPAPSRAAKGALAARSRDETVSALMLIEPSAKQSNVEVVQESAIQTLLATNHGRRHCQVRVYEIASQNAAGVRTDYPKAKLVSDLTSLGSTRALGFASTLFGFFSGTTAFVPVSTSPIHLEMASGATKTFFETVVLGSSTLLFDPSFFSESRYADEKAGWQSSVRNLNLISWFTDIIFGILLELWGLRDLGISSTAIENAIATLRHLEITSWLLIVEAAENGDFSAATRAFLALFSSNSEFVKSLQAALAAVSPEISRIIGTEASAASVRLVTAAVNAAFAVVGVIMGAGDLGAVLYDLANAQRGDRWSVTLFQPTLTLSPLSKTIRPGARLSFSVTPPAGVSGTIVYAWTQNSAFATLSSSSGEVGNSIETASRTVDLVTTPSDNAPVTVKVKAYLRDSSGGRILLGESQAAVTFGVSETTYPTTTRVITKLTNLGTVWVYGCYFFTPIAGATSYIFKDHLGNEIASLYKDDFDAGAPDAEAAFFADPNVGLESLPYHNGHLYNYGGKLMYTQGNHEHPASNLEFQVNAWTQVLADDPVTVTITAG